MKPRKNKPRKTARKPAIVPPSMPAGDPMSLVQNTRIDVALRLRMAINMLREKDRRAVPFLREVADTGKVKHRARAVSALMRYAGDVVAPSNEGEVGMSRDHINAELQRLESGGKAARDHAREWIRLVPGMAGPTLIQYLKSKEREDRA